MLHRIRNQIGTAGLIVAIVALVAALAGGAIAANSGGGKATSSAKAKKGPRGPKGATGPAGAAGAAGTPGANGKDGGPGKDGSPGSTGASGKSAVTGTLNPGQGGCAEGGAYVEVQGEAATKKSVCNGEAGTPGNNGLQGEPWTAGGTLPPSSADGCPCTETGTFTGAGAFQTIIDGNMAEKSIGTQSVRIPISFNIPIADPLDSSHAVYVDAFGVNPDPIHCPGSPEDPTAASGYLCVYGNSFGGTFSLIFDPATGGQGAATAGAVIIFNLGTNEELFAFGTWAVTG